MYLLQHILEWILFINAQNFNNNIRQREHKSLKYLCKSINMMCLKYLTPVFKFIVILLKAIMYLDRGNHDKFILVAKEGLLKYWNLPNIPRGYKLMLLNRMFQAVSPRNGHIDGISASDVWNSLVPNFERVESCDGTEIIHDVYENDGLDKSDFSLNGAMLFFEKYNCKRELRMMKKCQPEN